MATFVCTRCGKSVDSGGTALLDGFLICYDCCADNVREYMQTHDKIILYLTYEILDEWSMRKLFPVGTLGCTGHVSNWSGTLKFPIHSVRIGRHNIARWRYDVWFTGPDGAKWHGVQYGDNTQIVHCRKVKK